MWQQIQKLVPLPKYSCVLLILSHKSNEIDSVTHEPWMLDGFSGEILQERREDNLHTSRTWLIKLKTVLAR